MATVCIGMTHIAAHAYGTALAEALVAQGHHVVLAAGGIAADRLRAAQREFRADVAADIVDAVRPDVVVACIAGVEAADTIERALAVEAHARGIPWTCQEDSEGVASRPFFAQWIAACTPRVVCCTDPYSAERCAAAAAGVRTAVVGNPTWDAVVAQDAGSLRSTARAALEVGDGHRLIAYIGSKGIATVRESLQPCCRSVRRLGSDVVVAALFHPADPEWLPTVHDGAPFGCYGEDLEGVTVRTRAQVEAACGGKDLLPLLAASDVIVSPTSTEVVRAAILGRPVIRPLFPGDRRFLEAGGYPPPNYFSDVALGCSLPATTEAAFIAGLEALTAERSATVAMLAEAQAKYYRAIAGRCATRAAEVIMGAHSK